MVFGQKLGFPNEVWIDTGAGGDSAAYWHYFCEPVPGVVALIEPASDGKVICHFYHDSPKFKEARRTTKGRYLYVTTVGGLYISGETGLEPIFAVALIHDFINKRAAA